MPIKSADDFFLQELRDVYSAEKQLTEALPQMTEAVSSEILRKAFDEHLGQTRDQIRRLDRIFETLGESSGGETCAAMEGLVAEARELIGEIGAPELLDAALIAAAQKIEHYEIASYGTLRSLAESMGLDQVAALLTETLHEEEQTDAKLTDIAESEVNVRMLHMEDADDGSK